MQWNFDVKVYGIASFLYLSGLLELCNEWQIKRHCALGIDNLFNAIGEENGRWIGFRIGVCRSAKD